MSKTWSRHGKGESSGRVDGPRDSELFHSGEIS